MFTVSKETQLEFYESFGKSEKSVQEDVEIIKKWFETQRHLPEIMEDVKIRNFLNMNKFSIERTKQKIDMYYTMRTITPDFFLNPKSPKLDWAFNHLRFGCHPVLIDDKHRAFFYSLKKDVELVNMESVFNLFVASYEIRLTEDFIMDDLVVIDFTNVTLNSMTVMNPSVIHKFFNVYNKMFSMRIYKVIFINTPSYVSSVITILKSILQPKIFDRFQFCKDDLILKEIFPNELLPSNFGGSGASLETLAENLKAALAKHQDRFDLLDTLKVDETLRTEKLNNDELLGYHGNFKKLDVD